MTTLSYGLNISKKKSAAPGRPASGRPRNLFADSDSEDEKDNTKPSEEAIAEFGDEESKSTKPPKAGSKTGTKPPSKNPPPLSNLYGSLSTSHKASKHSEEATGLDPSIYDYDAFHTAASKAKPVKNETEDRKPKYMSNLFAAAEVRKRDQLRAKDKLLAKEREAEGDEYADKEKFVTEAYKEQQAEIRRLEEEEARKEEEQRRKGGKGMGAFYKSMLEKEEKRFENVVKVSEENIASKTEGEDEQGADKPDSLLAEEARKRGANVVVNDDGQITDKRELLSAGLNVALKPAARAANGSSKLGKESTTSQSQGGQASGARFDAKRAQRERQSRMMEEQLEQASKRAADDEADKQRELERAAKSRKTDGEIMGAKERYLARKREAEEAKKKKAEST